VTLNDQQAGTDSNTFALTSGCLAASNSDCSGVQEIVRQRQPLIDCSQDTDGRKLLLLMLLDSQARIRGLRRMTDR